MPHMVCQIMQCSSLFPCGVFLVMPSANLVIAAVDHPVAIGLVALSHVMEGDSEVTATNADTHHGLALLKCCLNLRIYIRLISNPLV